MELDRRGAELLFQVLAEREETNPVAIASNESFSGWTKTFTDPRLCPAIVDRLNFGGNIIETGTTSYRLAQPVVDVRSARLDGPDGPSHLDPKGLAPPTSGNGSCIHVDIAGLSLPAHWAYVALAACVAGSAVFPPLPSESVLVTGMGLAAAGRLDLTWVCAAALPGGGWAPVALAVALALLAGALPYAVRAVRGRRPARR